MIDEINSTPPDELNTPMENLLGLTEDWKIAKTIHWIYACCQFVQSNETMYCIIPVASLTFEKLKERYDKVMLQLREVIIVQAVSSNNHPINW